MLVTVSGPPGAGTTTASRLVADDLALERVPGGEVFRLLAAEAGMTVGEFGRHAADHPEVDRELDRRLLERAREGDCVVESRLAGWLAATASLDSVRVWVDCDPAVRAARVAEREGISAAQAAADNEARAALEQVRYQALYGFDLADLRIYDLVLDSGRLGPEAIADAVADLARRRFGA